VWDGRAGKVTSAAADAVRCNGAKCQLRVVERRRAKTEACTRRGRGNMYNARLVVLPAHSCSRTLSLSLVTFLLSATVIQVQRKGKERTVVPSHCGPKERKKERYSVDPSHNSKGKSKRGEKSKLLAGGVGRSGLVWAGDHEWHGHSGRVRGT